MKQPRTFTVSQLADKFRDDADMQSVAQLYATDHMGKRDLTLAQVLESVISDQHVPYVAALRYKDSGLRKRKQSGSRCGRCSARRTVLASAWTFRCRRSTPRATSVSRATGRSGASWTSPKERFISYSDANPDSDPTLLLGWAGWDYKDQAQTLVNVVNDRTSWRAGTPSGSSRCWPAWWR